nr:RluA family pseudouridine synthase [Bacteroidota bacterium]
MEEPKLDNTEESEELFEHHRIVADPKQSPIRIDKFLFNRIENVSRNKIQSAARAGNILVNESPVKPNYKIRPGDVISIVLPSPVREFEVIPEQIPFNILFEDNDILIVNKDAGIVVHPGHGNYTGTLLNALAWYFQDKGKQEDVFTSLVHRIDKDTSGALLVAKNELAQTKLGKQFFDHTIDRKYVALVWGDVEADEGTIVGHIGRNPKNRLEMFVFPDGDQGRHAITHYKVLERFGYVTLVECRLETGRTHQIRAHFRFIGHALFNDARYGGDQILKGTTFTKYRQFIQNCFKILPRQALHAQTLEFVHPGSGKPVSFFSPLPDDFSELIEKWRHYVQHRDVFQD